MSIDSELTLDIDDAVSCEVADGLIILGYTSPTRRA
jgi:exoribonuclease R